MHSDWIHLITLGFVVISLTLSYINRRFGSPVLALYSRWVRWVSISWIAGGLAHIFSNGSLPLGFALPVALVTWFIVETVYNYVAIKALSHSEMPLFPKFEINENGEEWPSQKRFIRLKDWVRDSGYHKVKALVGFLGETLLMRVSIYDSSDKKTRLHVLFIPHYHGNVAVCFSFTSITRQGIRLITDNVFFPFGGFYPDSWYLERKPLARSIEKLQQRHLARVDARAEELVEIDEDPETGLNHDQHQIERVNRELRFLHPPGDEEESGRITSAGRYRIWQEIWLLSYFGKSLKYS